MKILVIAASKHGSTYEIGEAVAEVLGEAGHAVTMTAAKGAPAAADYDAAIIGSAVYAGNWLGEAQEYVERNRKALGQMPVWLFSSGPLGDVNPQPEGNPVQYDELMAVTGALGHQIFVGKLDRSQLNFGERLIVKAVKAPYGDFRNWEAIREWAREVAASLETEEVSHG